MNDGTTPVTAAPVLTSWKEIARYMGKGVRTVQRWEQDFGLPIRRPNGSNKKAILARPHDLDAWVALRCSSRPDGAARSAGSVLPNGFPASRLSVGALSALSAQIETARILQNSNHMLMSEIRSALEQLNSELLSIAASRC